ncbi:uncharacterized protein N7479_007103 [Penicillium vulpinum]|uniref:Nephrocystin 3-like N-terminal domain-containing protein n=1 Tax=Penicillium vulpinum TaxID=29845 RepID=A0A1V6S3R1_9EURO|nr:uncharacterized protein N7479_007103 [Penicillium vulpinum]KAJ5959953.1 hypothetical protein N7479_007103 [Penicillium vulpinum]OQE08273.1 hypothetical protein PENVUL_c010G08069 [Penicillium vulpinum]
MVWLKKQHKRTAAEYVLEKAVDYHEAFGTTPAVYNEDEDNIEELPASADLQQSLVAYNESVDPKFRFNIRECTFEDVVEELDHAREEYEKKAKGLSGILHRGVRAVGDYADQITPWVDLIPSDNGLCFLGAGLKIIFGIARQNATDRERILGAFDNIPDLILSAEARQNQWATAKKLRTAAIRLYETLARAMAQLIFLLNGSTSHAPRWSERALKIIRRVRASPHTGRSIDSILGEVQGQADVFNRCLEHVRDQRAIDTGADVAENKELSKNIDNKISALSQAAEKGYADLIKKIENHPSGPVITNLLYQVVVHVDQPQDDRAWEYPALRSALKPEPLLDELELHDILGVSPQHPTNDIQLILKELDQFTSSAQAQAQQLFASPAFTSWMASTQPTSLLVHGNFAESGPGRINPLSILCAMLALQLRRNSNAEKKPTIILHYFCGLHGSRHNRVDSLVGPSGLIRSFLAQLLQTGRRFNLDFINTKDFVYQLEAHNIQKLCSTFLELIEQLPRKATIICIIDGLSEFTSQQFKDELVDVVHILNRLVTHRTLHPNFKLLCTTPLARDRLLDQKLNVEYPLQLQHAIEDSYEPVSTDRAFQNLTSQSDRLDHFRMRMRINQAAEQENRYSESDSEDDSDW